MKTNRKVKYTKMVLNESFLKFLAEKPLSRITVKEICEEADINRSTYYVHFTDPYDQLKKLETEIMVDMAIYVDTLTEDIKQDEKRQFQIIKGVLDYIFSKKHVFQVLLSKNGDFNLERDILTYFGERMFSAEIKKIANTKEEFAFIYASTGCFGILYHWIIDEINISSEEVANMIIDFTMNIRKSNF